MKAPILITGVPRSGTSMVAGAIELCGAFGGEMFGASKNNPKGMYENKAIREEIVKPYIKSIGADPRCQHPLPSTEDMYVPLNTASRVRSAIESQGYAGGPWFYKCPKLSLIWPVWDYAFPKAKWLIVRRRTGDIVQSCLKTGFMNAYARPSVMAAVGAKTEEEGWIWWVREHEKRFVQMIEAGLNVKVIWPERMVSGDYEQLYEAIDWLGLHWTSKVLDFIDPKLWKARRNNGGD